MDLIRGSLADIRAVEAGELEEHVAEVARASPVLFCGCAPCQPFTKQNTTRPNSDEDERIPLLLRFGDLIEACAPDLVFVENVPGLQHYESSSPPFDSFLERLDACE